MSPEELLMQLDTLVEELTAAYTDRSGSAIAKEKKYSTVLTSELANGTSMTAAKEIARAEAWTFQEDLIEAEADILILQERRDQLRLRLDYALRLEFANQG